MSTARGRRAEELVAEYLKRHRHVIVAMNWRTRRCEIDVISTHKKTVYFTEVKYRSSSNWGEGLDYITEAKLTQMRFAAELWLAQHDWRGQVCLQAASVDSNDTITLIEL